jgi:hypothetical protein
MVFVLASKNEPPRKHPISRKRRNRCPVTAVGGDLARRRIGGLRRRKEDRDQSRWLSQVSEKAQTALRGLCPKAACTRCGVIGADVRPEWSERVPRESLTGAQWSP